MKMGVLTWFKTIMLVQLFYALAISMLVYSMPADTLTHVTSFSDVTDTVNLNSTALLVQESLESQTEIPIIEIGALVFYSGNIMIDLLLNFAFAIPQMIGMLFNGIQRLLNIDGYLFAAVELFFAVLMVAMYFIGIIQLLTGIRSGRTIE